MSHIAHLCFLLLKSLISLYTVLTYPLYSLFTTVKSYDSKTPMSKTVDSSDTHVTLRSNVESCPRREEILNRGERKINTVAKIFAFMVEKYGDRQAMGTRNIIGEEKERRKEDGKEFSKLVMEDTYSWLSYKEVAEKARDFGRGIRELGVNPGEKVCIYSDTRSDWMVSAAGCFQNTITLCTIYTNLGEDGLVHGITETEVSTVIVSLDLLPKLLAVKDRIPLVKNIIYFDSAVRPEPVPVEGITLHPFNEVLEKGKESIIEPAAPGPEDTAIIMYTSGSTGVPKGVIISHRNMVSAMLSLLNIASLAIEESEPAGPDDSYIAFLPLAHIFELLSEHVMLLLGIKIGYSSPNTLTDKGTMIRRGERGDASILGPTIMASVPLILDRIYKGIKSNVAMKGMFAQLLLEYCFEYRAYWSQRGHSTPIMDKLIFNKMKSLLGGRLKVLMCGGAPLSEEVHSLVRSALSCQLFQCYGMTETCCAGTVCSPGDLAMGQVGPPLIGVDLRLENWDEAGYTVKDSVGPRGEIVIGGDSTSGGYYNNKEEELNSFFTVDGVRFCRTGDIGQVLPNGSIRIIDRKKDLVKLQAGEYVSLGKVEANLKISPIVETICVYGDSKHTSTVALIVPDEDKLRKLAESLGKKYAQMSKKRLCNDADIIRASFQLLIEQVRTTGSSRLERFEIPRKIRLVPEGPWLPESGLVTAAFKLKRRPIEERYRGMIEEMYRELDEEEERGGVNGVGKKRR